ncbi:MAG: bifunctional diguanylate cyclase/phosphodiesterase [Amphritea sp.]
MFSDVPQQQSSVQCLVIDSCEFNNQALIERLQKHQRYTLQCCPFDLATELIEQHQLDIIFLHTCHTDTNTFSELHYLRQQHPLIPVIIFDHKLSSNRADEFLYWRATDYLALEDLNDAILERIVRYALAVNRYQTEIERLSRSDLLTGMTNRQHFLHELSKKLKKITQRHNATEECHSLALLCIDLDGYRRFNNLNGHNAGDQLIKELGKRLKKTAPGLISRLGNDEFVMLLECPPGEDINNAATLLCYQLLHTLTEPYRYKELEIILPCSIGVALAPEHSCETDTLVHHATQARLKAKQQSSCSYAFFDQRHPTNKESQLSIEPELMNAIRRCEFQLYYQPRVDISTGKILGAEALIRWNHPEKGLIQPNDFIPTAERTGLIVPMGYWVIQQAGIDMQTLKDAQLAVKHISVNLSFRQFQDSYLCRTIQRIIEKDNIDTSILELELTESALFNNELHVLQGIEELHKLGINFALDDFGTGYSSFSLLQKLPISSLKIDRSFILDITENSDNQEIVKALINLAYSLKKEIIAEGVETPAQQKYLADLGCKQVQGYLYSPPVPFSDFMALLEADNQVRNGICESL